VRNRQLALDAAMALLAAPDAALTVEAIARKADLGAATVVRAFGGKDALLDAAVSRLLEPVVPDLVAAVEEMINGARRDGAIRTDLDPAVVTTLITETAHAIARAKPPSQNLADAYLSVLLDGLRPAP
jgi:AcrR family transcriptional regulator